MCEAKERRQKKRTGVFHYYISTQFHLFCSFLHIIMQRVSPPNLRLVKACKEKAIVVKTRFTKLSSSGTVCVELLTELERGEDAGEGV